MIKIILVKKALDISILSYLLSSGLLDHFTITSFKKLGDVSVRKDCFFIYLDEKNELPLGYSESAYKSKGFFESVCIQAFPLCGKAVYLRLGKRRWHLKTDKSTEIKSDYSFIAVASKLILELSDFLKGTGREPRRYDK